MWGFPTLIAVPKNWISPTITFIFFVSIFSLRGIWSQLVFGFPMFVWIKLFFNIFDSNFPEEVSTVIKFFELSFDNKLATHLVPFPHAAESEPSEFLKVRNASNLSLLLIRISWSQPILPLLQIFFIWELFRSYFFSRWSIMTKSFPSPSIL